MMRFAALIGGVVLLASCGGGDSSGRPATGNDPVASHQSESGKVKMISQGKAYSKEDVVVPGKVVLLEFTAPW